MLSKKENMTVSAGDKVILRELARKVAEIGNRPEQKQKAELWRRHNDLERVRPMVLIFPEGAWAELLPDQDLQTGSDLCRGLERDLRMRIYYWEHMRDDNVIEPVIA